MPAVLENRQLPLFRDRLPYRPYCTDDLGSGLRVRPQQLALEKKYIQYNGPAIINWLAFDIDRVYVAEAEWAIVAPPNIVVRNPANGHAHLLYGIAAGVCKTNAARIAPLKLLAAINEGYRHALGADTGFTELICKNPLHAYWDVTTPRLELYDLVEMAEWVDLDASDRRVRATPKRAQVGMGRNCNLFNSLRTWAYKWFGEYGNHSFDRWQEAVHAKAEKLNTFKDPLPASEIKATAKSVAKWTWTNYTGRMTASSLAADGLTLETFSLVQSNLGQMGNAKRWDGYEEKRTQALQMLSSGAKQAEIVDALKVSRRTLTRWINDVKNTNGTSPIR